MKMFLVALSVAACNFSVLTTSVRFVDADEESETQLHTLQAMHIRKDGSHRCNNSTLSFCNQLASRGRISVDDVASQLAISRDAAYNVFQAVGAGRNDSMSCGYLCGLLLQHAPALLQANVPTESDKACLDKECTKEIDVSDVALVVHRLPGTGSNPRLHPNNTLPPNVRREPAVLSAQGDVLDNVRQLLNTYFSLYPVPELDRDIVLPDLGPKIRSRVEIRDRVLEAAQKAAAWTASALRKLESTDKHTTGRLKNFMIKWFGKHRDIAAAKLLIRKTISGTHKVLNRMLVRKGGGNLDLYQNKDICSTGIYAYVYPGQTVLTTNHETRYVVNLCDKVLESDDWVFYGRALVHEATHHVNTFDWIYGSQECEELAINAPMRAITNADNFEHFIDDLVANFARGSAKTWLPPLLDNDGARWRPGERVLVRDSQSNTWHRATVLTVKDGVLVVHKDGTNYWTWVSEAKRYTRIDCGSASMGDSVLVKDLEKDEWLMAIVKNVDESGNVIAEVENREDHRTTRNPKLGWKYCEIG